jgi:predicted dithiol-disulfide oxidoreductase (DUF899 family)
MSDTTPRTVTRDEWLAARRAFLEREKAFDRERDALAAARRALPRVKIDKPYVFREPSGERTLLDLFDGQPQLIVYHFMLAPGAAEGCKGCSYVADNIEGGWRHFTGRDTAFAMVSRADIPTIEAFKKRMGWTMRWLSSGDSDFNHDFGVSFRTEEESHAYNFGTTHRFGPGERPGLSCFVREGKDVLHTYSTYERGLDLLLSTYNYLDLTPLGRHEEGLSFSMAWVRHHDRYETANPGSR